MKRTFVALVVGFIFLVPVTGWSAQAGTLSEGVHGTIGEFMEWQPLQLSIMPQELIHEGNRGGTDWQVSNLVEPVAIPVMVSEESWMKDYGND